MDKFKLVTDFTPKGDQPAAISRLVDNLNSGTKHQTLLGVTGSGKTFTIANVIAQVNRPTLVMAHNKTLTAQLYGEFKELFPDNAVEFFVSFYDYYQPEAYIPSTDTFIDKDSLINDDIERLRHSATMSVLQRRDTIVVASVSCIFGIGAPADYMAMHMNIEEGAHIERDRFLHELVQMQYERSGSDLKRGYFRVRGDVVEILPSFSLDRGVRIEFFGDDIERVTEIDPLTGVKLRHIEKFSLFPNSHWLTPTERLEPAMKDIEVELKERVEFFLKQGQLVEAQRIEQRTRFDMEMLKEFGYCQGIENYSRYLSGRSAGEAPYTLMNYFPDDYLVVIDESHATVPQVGGMYNGDRSRKSTLIDFGFRLPSALDNRPLTFEEFEGRIKQAIYISATPGPYELEHSGDEVVEQIVRPTGLLDPEMVLRPTAGQVDNLLGEIRKRVELNQRVLVTTLTKKMAEDLSEYYIELGVKARYLHADIDTLERVEILRDLRHGKFHVLIGVNLLREGLDLPEVSLVAIMDADKEGFLRSERSLIQTSGRASRHLQGKVIMYADTITGSMQRALDVTTSRRERQQQFNDEHNISPQSIVSNIKDVMSALYESTAAPEALKVAEAQSAYNGEGEAELKELEAQMREAAHKLEFEEAARLRDRVKAIRKQLLGGVI